MSNLTIRIPEKLRNELKRECREQQRPASELVRESLRRYLAQEQLRRLRQRMRPKAEAMGFFTDEDIFRVVS